MRGLSCVIGSHVLRSLLLSYKKGLYQKKGWWMCSRIQFNIPCHTKSKIGGALFWYENYKDFKACFPKTCFPIKKGFIVTHPGYNQGCHNMLYHYFPLHNKMHPCHLVLDFDNNFLHLPLFPLGSCLPLCTHCRVLKKHNCQIMQISVSEELCYILNYFEI